MPIRRSETLYTGDRETVAAWIVLRIEAGAQQAIATRGQFSLAIAGGSVAQAVIPRLCSARVAWANTHIFWVDERNVGADDVNSNSGQAARMWAGSSIAAEAHIHVMTDGVTALAKAAVAYDRLLRHQLGDDPVFDIVLLGVGDDGHVASLFPDHAALDNQPATVLGIDDSPKPPPRRLTLSLPLLTQARETIVAPFGAGKANVMKRVLVDGDVSLPVARVINTSINAIVTMDNGAASAVPLNILQRIV